MTIHRPEAESKALSMGVRRPALKKGCRDDRVATSNVTSQAPTSSPSAARSRSGNHSLIRASRVPRRTVNPTAAICSHPTTRSSVARITDAVDRPAPGTSASQTAFALRVKAAIQTPIKVMRVMRPAALRASLKLFRCVLKEGVVIEHRHLSEY